MNKPPDKYAHVDLEAAGIPLKPGESWFLLRGKDLLTPMAMQDYADRLDSAGRTAMAEDVRMHSNAILAWQRANPDYVKLPD